MNSPVWQNGRIVDMSDALIPAESSAVLAARAVFDGCRLFVHQRGARRWAFTISMPLHLKRLQRSCKAVGIALPYSSIELTKAAAQVIDAARPEEDMGLRWFVTEVDQDAKHIDTIVTVFARPLKGYTKAEPYSVNFARRTRWVGPGIPYSVKTMSHYAASRNETLLARHAGFDDCLFVNQFGNVTESPRANLVFLSAHEIHSPLMDDGILAGLTRESLRSVIGQTKTLQWVDRSVSVRQLASYIGVLMLSSSLGIVPVERVGPYRYGTASSQEVADLWLSATQNPGSFFPSAIDEFIY